MEYSEEKEPLLGKRQNQSTLTNSLSLSSSINHEKQHHGSMERSSSSTDITIKEPEVHLKKHINLIQAIGIIVGNVIGSGIFLSSKGVTENMGSVGGSLILWGMVGVYVLLQALCYTELASIMPVAGGDYAYAYRILGDLAGFLVAWIHVAIIAPAAAGAIAQTAGLYIAKAAGQESNQALVSLIAVMVILMFLFINAASVRVATVLNTILSAFKIVALSFIIIVGFTWIIFGNTENLQSPFKGNTENPGLIALAMLDCYYAYKGWETVTALPEEMINPKRNLPIALITAVIVIVSVYVLTNVAYFATLTIDEVIKSDAVALTFAEKLVGKGLSSILAVAVALSCMGTVNGGYLADTRYLFASGRNGHVPPVLAMVNYKYFSPLPALFITAVMYLIYTSIPLLDQLVEYASLAVQVKIGIAITAFLLLKWKKPNLERPLSIHWSIGVFCLCVIVAMLGLSLYKNPATAATGIGLCLMGAPLYILKILLPKLQCSTKCNASLTYIIQKLLLVVGENTTENASNEHKNTKAS